MTALSNLSHSVISNRENDSAVRVTVTSSPCIAVHASINDNVPAYVSVECIPMLSASFQCDLSCLHSSSIVLLQRYYNNTLCDSHVLLYLVLWT